MVTIRHNAIFWEEEMKHTVLLACAVLVALLRMPAALAGDDGQWVAVGPQCKVYLPWGGLIDPAPGAVSPVACENGALSGAQTLELDVQSGPAHKRSRVHLHFQAAFAAGKANGHGVFVVRLEKDKLVPLRYVGGFADGLADGKGKLVYNEFFVQEGWFHAGELNGRGRQYFTKQRCGGSEGEYVNGRLEGSGSTTLCDGAKNIGKAMGNYHHGRLVGRGTWLHPDGSTTAVIQDAKGEWQLAN
jgi:hypothetical protein